MDIAHVNVDVLHVNKLLNGHFRCGTTKQSNVELNVDIPCPDEIIIIIIIINLIHIAQFDTNGILTAL